MTKRTKRTKKKKTAKKYILNPLGVRLYNPEFLVTRRVYREALKEINRIRATMGHTPLKTIPFGMRNSTYSCPIANALGSPDVSKSICIASVAGDRIKVYGTTGVDMPTPPVLQEFIFQFDEEVGQ